MIGFLARRFGHAFFMLWGVSLLAFLLIDLAPGQPFDAMRLNPQISQKTLASLRKDYGMDRPLQVRYFRWVQSVMRGDLGFSFAYNRPVWQLLRTRLRNTLVLAITALLCSWLIAIAVGVWTAARQHQWPDRISGLATSFLLVTPDVLIGLGLLAFALHTGWLPTGGMTSLAFPEMPLLGKGKDLVLHMVLPVSALMAVTLPMLVRHVRSAVAGVLGSQFIRAAQGHGIPRRTLLLRHALPAAMNPLISLFGVSMGMLLGASILIEVIMSWPGVGPLLVHAILERDPYVVIGVVMLSTLLLITGNLMADIGLCIADPRIRVSSRRGYGL